jgi:hypothetical protein
VKYVPSSEVEAAQENVKHLVAERNDALTAYKEMAIELQSTDKLAETVLEFNLNQAVYIRLTDNGRLFLKQKHDQIFSGSRLSYEYLPPREDDNGWSQWQLWNLMNVFGDQFYWGNFQPNLFDLTIRFNEWEFNMVNV